MVFLPADVARLVLDYLGSEGYEKSCETFLLECNHVAAICDYIDQHDADINDLLPLTDKSLNDILHEYSVNKLALKRKRKHERQTSLENAIRLNERELISDASLNPVESRRQNTRSYQRLRRLRAQQSMANDAKFSTLTQQSPVVPLSITKAYSDIPPGAVIVDPPDTSCRQVQRSSDFSVGQNAKSRQLPHASTLNGTTTTKSLPTPTQPDRIVKHPSDFSYTREFQFLEKLSSQARLNHQPTTNQNSDEAEPMEYTSPVDMSLPNQTSPADEQRQLKADELIETPEEDGPKSIKEKDDLKEKTVEEPTFSLADEDIREFPMLLEKLLSDSNLQQKLAENINKALPSDHNQPNVSTPFKTSELSEEENRKMFTDSFLDVPLSEDTIHDIVEMTTVDPAFEGLFNLFSVNKQDFMQENLQQKEKSTCEALHEERMEQNQSPTKPSFLFNECSNSAMIPTSPERSSTSSFLDKALWKESSEIDSKLTDKDKQTIVKGDQSLDLPDNTGHRRKSRKPAKKDVLETSSIVMMASLTPKKTDSCARTLPYTARKTNNIPSESVVARNSSTAQAYSPKNSSLSESVCVVSEESDTSVSPPMAALHRPVKKQIPANVEPKRLSEQIVEMSEDVSDICFPLGTDHTDSTSKKTVVEDVKEIVTTITSSLPDEKVDDFKDIPQKVDGAGEIVIETNKVGNSLLKCLETFSDIDQTGDQLRFDAIANNVAEEDTEGDEGAISCKPPDTSNDPPPDTSNDPPPDTSNDPPPDTSNDPPPDETENVTTVSIAASILAFAMQESRSPIKLNQKEDNSKVRRSPEKSKQLTPLENVPFSQPDNLTNLISNKQTTVSSTSGCNDELKQSEMEAIKTTVKSQDDKTSLPPILNISLKSQPSQVIYSCPVEGLSGNNSVIRPKNITDDTPPTIVINMLEWREKRRSRSHLRPIMPAGVQLPSVDQVINIPCLIDPVLIGSSGDFPTTIPVTYVPHDDDSSLSDSNIFEKLSNLPILSLCQPVDGVSSSQPISQNVPVNQPETGVNVVSSWQFANTNQTQVIKSVASISDFIREFGPKDSVLTEEEVANGKQNATSTKIVSGRGKKSNRSKRRIRPIPVSSEQLPQNTAFTSAMENENTKKLQTIDLMDLQSLRTASPDGCINIIQTPVNVVVKRSADGVISLEEVVTDTSQSPACPGSSSSQVSEGSATKGRSRLRKQDLSKQSHVRILDFDDEIITCEPKEKSTKGRKTAKKSTGKPVSNKTSKKSPPKKKKATEVKEQEIIKPKTPTKLAEDLPLKKRPIPNSTSEFLDKSPTKLNAAADKIPSKKRPAVRRSPRRKAATKKPKSPLGKEKPEEKKTKKETLQSAKSPRKPKVTRKNADEIQKSSPAKKNQALKSSLKQTKSPQELKRVSFGEVDSITVNSPDVSHNIDEEVNEAAQTLMDIASCKPSPTKPLQGTVGQVGTAELVSPGIVIPGIVTPGIMESPRKSPRKHLAITDEGRGIIEVEKKPDKKRKRDAKADKSKKSHKKRREFPKDMDIDKFLSGLKY